jgi:cytochrome c
MARILTLSVAVVLGAAGVAGIGALSAANVAPGGQKIFKSECSVCHSDAAKGGSSVGPRLFGVVGRRAGTLPGYHYSSAMEMAGLVWTEPNLEKYIANPKSVIPGDKMPYAGLKDAAKRQALVDYLSTLK